MSSIVVEKKINTDNFQGKVVYPKKRLPFNDWINKIYDNIEKANDEKYGFNKPSTIKT